MGNGYACTSGKLSKLLGEKICPVCGKKYYCAHETIYKYTENGHKRECCSYTCWAKKLKEQGKW
jgi:hypothetical protein